MADLDPTRAYYDEFAAAYEARRPPNDPHGYHALVDDLEVELVEKYGRSKDVLECGCGTGLLLERFAGFAKRAVGIDLSPRMLDQARARGLDVREGSVVELPFKDDEFDVTCSFKVLAHVPDIGRALAEMVRVTKPGGHVLAEFYNPLSFRALAKRVGPAGKISSSRRKLQSTRVSTRPGSSRVWSRPERDSSARTACASSRPLRQSCASRCCGPCSRASSACSRPPARPFLPDSTSPSCRRTTDVERLRLRDTRELR